LIIERYCNICAAGGDEGEIRKCVMADIEGYVDEVSVSPLGNLTAFKKGSRKNGSILLTAHMDEVAFIVKSVEKEGLIKFYPIGGLLTKTLVGKAVYVGKKKLPGVIGHKSFHYMSPEERKKVPAQKELSIDVGATSKEDVKDVSPGDYVYFRSEFFIQNNHYYGKAFDDRAGCCALTEVLRGYRGGNRPELSIIATYTVQEEVGLRGGATAAYGHRDILFNLNLEATTCSDRELKKTYSPSTVIGEGPVFSYMDMTSIANRPLLDFVTEVARRNKIPFQFKKTVTGGTDSGAIHLTEEGVPSVTMSVPVRYIHAPWGIMNRKDFKDYVRLAKAVVREAENFQFIPGQK
jgi:putative aminopeptidase FrvX